MIVRVAPWFLLVAAACRVEPAVPPGKAKAAADEHGAEVLAVMDEKADPCADFYRYACGEWIDETEIPADQSRYGRFHVLRERNLDTQRAILAELPTDAAESSDEARLGRFYGSCMDEAAIEARGTEPLGELVAEVDRVEDLASAFELAGRLAGRGIHPFLSWGVGPDDKNPAVYLADLSQGGLGLPDREFYLGTDEASTRTRQAYQRHVASMLGMLGDPQAEASAAAIVGLETRLAEISTKRDQMRDPEVRYHRIARSALAKQAPGVPWDAYFTGLGSARAVDAVNLAPHTYFAALGKALAGVDAATLRAYLRWHVLHGTAEHLPRRFVDEDFAFFGKTLQGQRELAPRWKRCVQATDQALGEALGRLFVERTFSGDSKTVALDMIRRVEGAFEAGLPNLAWMDPATRERALEKMHAVVNKIGYPDTWRDYSAVDVGTDHLANVLAAAEHDFARQAKRVGGPVDRAEWHMTPPTVNAYYNANGNEMVFPAGILQPPFFSAERPMAMNFGGIGMVMGHELTHGFDDQGRKYDAQGRLSTWWAPDVSARFEERAQCIEKLYDTYTVADGVHLNGKLTLGENIADFGGIREAYGAYRTWAAEQPKTDPAVPGLTDEQLFFVSFGQIWCQKSTAEADRLMAMTDPHAHPRYRVNGPLASLPEFWEAFSCEEGTAMHPENSCQVW
jgi:putative endopeptidase